MQKSMAKLTGQIGQFVVIKQENFSLPSPTYTKVFPKQNNQHKKNDHRSINAKDREQYERFAVARTFSM